MKYTQHILLAHTDNRIRENIINILRAAGFSNIIDAHDGYSAIQKLHKGTCDIAIMDISLDQIDGWQLTRLIRSGALPISPDIPLFLISKTYSTHMARVTAQSFEITDFIDLHKIETLPETIISNISLNNNSLKNPKLLIVEDYPDTARLIERTLEKCFDIEIATDGVSGLSAWTERRHDLVLLDIMLPKMRGDEVLDEILKIDSSQSVVMMTAHDTGEHISDLILRGAIDFINKPFRTEQLRNVCTIASRRNDYIISHNEFHDCQQSLFEESQRFSVTLESLTEGVISINKNSEISYINQTVINLFNWHPPKSIDQPLLKIIEQISPDDKVTNKPLSPLDFVKNIPNIQKFCFTLIDNANNKHALESTISQLTDYDGSSNGCVLVLHDITDHYLLTEKLSHQASHDELTGLANRHGLDQALSLALDDCVQHEQTHALCYMDLDKFKFINDSCGHSAGDQLLLEVVNIFKKHVRPESDFISRVGGDEFILLLKNCSVKKAKEIAITICAEIEGFIFCYEQEEFSISVSIGIIEINNNTRSFKDTIYNVDAACYVAKRNGRGCVHVHESNL